MKDKKIKKHRICNFLLFVAFISSIANFIITILYNHDTNLLIDLISSLIFSIFVIFYIFSQITNHRKDKSTVVIASLFLIIYSCFQIAFKSNLLTILKSNQVDNFYNQSLVDVIKWSQKNKVKVNQVYEYSDLVDEYHIISQSSKEGTPTKKIKSLDIVVSEGPNPNKEIIVPDMTTWDTDRVLKYIKKNKLNNIEVEFQISDKNKNTVIEQNKSGNMRRSDELKLIFSLGDEEEVNDTKLVDFTNMDEFEAIFFLKQHSLKYEIKKDFSTRVKRNYIVKQNKKMGTIIKPNDEENKVILTVSKGKKIKMPNLSKYSVIKITNWAIKNNLKLEFKNRYDDSIAFNKIISVSHQKGEIIEQGTLVTVTISKGKLVMQSFHTLDEFRVWAIKNNINYEEKYEFHTEIKEGEVISYSHKKGDIIKNDDTIVVTISQGKKTKVPSVIGNTKNEAIKKLEEAKLKYNIVYENSEEAKNKVIKQSLSSGSEVAQNSTITLTLSNGKKPTKSNNSNISSSSNKNSNQGNIGNSNSSQKACDKSKTTTIDLYPGDTGSQTEEMTRDANPGIKFIFEMVSQCSNGSPTRGSVCNASSLTNIKANYCDTYKVIIVK